MPGGFPTDAQTGLKVIAVMQHGDRGTSIHEGCNIWEHNLHQEP